MEGHHINNFWGAFWGVLTTAFFHPVTSRIILQLNCAIPSANQIIYSMIIASITAATGAVVGYVVTRFVLNPLFKKLTGK